MKMLSIFIIGLFVGTGFVQMGLGDNQTDFGLLPDEPVIMLVMHDPQYYPAYFETNLFDMPDGNYIVTDDELYMGWCVDEHHTIAGGQYYETTLYSTYEEDIPFPDEDWPKINYLINHKIPGATVTEIQEAIWHFFGEEYTGTNPRTLEMIGDAIDNGNGFVPSPGEKLAVICYVNPNIQTTFIEVTLSEDTSVERKALLIGCWDYPGTKDDLDPWCKNDINSVHKLIKDGYNWDDDEIIILSDDTLDQVEKSDIQNQLSDDEFSDSNLKFFYYTGHGGREESGNEREAIVLSSDEVYYDNELWYDFFDLENVIAIFDSCNSGGLSHKKDNTPDGNFAIKGILGDFLIGTACRSDELSKISDYNSVYTKYLIESFTHSRDIAKSKIPGDNDRVSVEEALLYAKENYENLLRNYIFFTAHPQIDDSLPIENPSDQMYFSENIINDYWSIESNCPVHLHAYDSNNNHVGYMINGIDNEIDGMIYCPLLENEFLVCFNQEDATIEVESFDDGFFTLECKNYDDESQETKTIVYSNIPITSESTASLSVNNGDFTELNVDADGDGETDSVVEPTIYETPVFSPSANFNYEPIKPFINQEITFDGSISFDPDGEITDYNWEFDDGTFDNGETVTHSFANPGVYEIVLTVTDDDGLTHKMMKKVEVLIPSTIDINPDTLNTKSKGKWITSYIELPEEFDPAEINSESILLNDLISPENHPMNVGDYNNDGIQDLMVKFDRQSVIDILETGDNVEVKITGEMIDGTHFEGVDTIKVI